MSSWHRRHALLALAELAAKAKAGHNPQSRWRLRRFCEALAAIEGNDEIEVTRETVRDADAGNERPGGRYGMLRRSDTPYRSYRLPF